MKILVRLPNWIGDAVMAVPALERIRFGFPEAELFLLGRDPAVSLFDHHPGLSFLFKIPGKGWKEDLKTATRLFPFHFQKGFLFTNSFLSALTFTLAGVQERIGYNRDGRGLLLHRAIEPDFSTRKPFVQYYLDLVAAYGLEQPPSPRVALHLGDEEREWALSQLGPAQGPRIGIAPGAAYGDTKKWFPERFRRTALLLEEAFHCQTFVFGGSGDKEDCLKASTPTSKNLAGVTSIRQTMALLERMDLLLCNDSGLMHLASALGTPVLAVFGPTSPTSTAPANPPFRILHHPPLCAPCRHRACPYDLRLCMKAVSVDEAFAAAKELLHG